MLARSAEAPEGFDGVWLAAPQDPQSYARALYANLRALDDANADVILVDPSEPPATSTVPSPSVVSVVTARGACIELVAVQTPAATE